MKITHSIQKLILQSILVEYFFSCRTATNERILNCILIYARLFAFGFNKTYNTINTTGNFTANQFWVFQTFKILFTVVCFCDYFLVYFHLNKFLKVCADNVFFLLKSPMFLNFYIFLYSKYSIFAPLWATIYKPH